MKRFWPLYLALCYWLLVLVNPPTREGMVAAWRSQPRVTVRSDSDAAIGAGKIIPTDEWRRLGQLPRDKSVQTYIDTMSWTGDNIRIDKLAKRYPNDALFIAMQLQYEMSYIHWDLNRNDGPVSNPLGTRPPVRSTDIHDIDWSRFIARARRGQVLEPNNTYFDWMLLFGLYANYRDEEAGEVLKKASTKSGYDSHLRELVLSNFEVMRRIYGSPIPPDRLMRLAYINWWFGPLHKVAGWTMDNAVVNREKGQHARALDNTYHMLRLSRLMRQEGYTLWESELGLSCEELCLRNSKRSKPTKNAGSGGKVNLTPRLLTTYAKEHSRFDILAFVGSEQIEMQNWAHSGMYKRSWFDDDSQLASLITYSNDFQTILLKTLPVTLVLCAIFGGLAWFFRTGTAHAPQYLRGALLGTLSLPVLLMASHYLEFVGDRWRPLVTELPIWFIYGLPLLLLCASLRRAGQWQRNQQGPAPTLKQRFKGMTPNADEGLPNLDFGWLLGVAIRVSYWAIQVTLLLGFRWQFITQSHKPTQIYTYALGLLALATGWPVAAFLIGWSYRPQRGETLRLGFRYIHQTMAGYLIIVSVIYALLALGLVSAGVTFENQWLDRFYAGETQMARMQIGH